MSLGYFNDYMNRNIVLTTFILFYGYLSYNSTQLKRHKNWSSVTCNPLEMVIGSIFDYENSNKQFEKCVQYSMSTDHEKRIQDYSKEINSDLQKKINSFTANSSSDNSATNALLNKTANKIKELKNESLDNETTINKLKIKIEQLTNQINNSFDTFRDSSNNLLNKLAL